MNRRRLRAVGAGAPVALGAALVLAVLALAGVPGAVLIAVGGTGGVALLLAGLHHRRVLPTDSWPWMLAGSVMWTVGAVLHEASSGSGTSGLVGLGLEVTGLVVLGGGVMSRSGRVAAGDPLPLIDATVVMLGGAFPAYIVLSEATAAVADPLRVLLYLGQVAGVATLGTVAFAVAVGEPRRAVSTTMLVLAAGAAVLAHGIDQVATLRGAPAALSQVLALVAVSAPLLAGAAAWAPDASADLAARRAARLRTGAKQIVVVGLASVLVPAVIAVEVIVHGRVHLGEGLGLAVVLISLVMTRVLVIVRRLGRQAAELEARVWTDPVTGLGNREAFLRRLAGHDEAGSRPGCLVLLDLDHFTELRDALGVATTDALLHAVGQRFAQAAPPGFVGRLGKGAFGLVLPQSDRDQATLVARALLATLDRPLALDDLTLQMAAAAGVVPLDDSSSADQLLQSADLALEDARRTPGRVASFGAGTGSGAGLALLLPDLRAALEHRDLVLHFQPQVDIASGRVTAVEALVRWQHAVHGLIAPGAFIPLAERTGFIARITRYVLDEVLEQCARWWADGMSIAVAVNLSVQDLLDPGLVEFVRRALERHGLAASALELEVTETDAMVDPEQAVATMAALASLGVTMSVDDFGTGYSSLSYLGRLPVHRLKIDRGFIAGMRVDEASAAIVAATIDLARRLGLQAVAEGVEDDETYHELASMGCDAAQGFGLSRPVPAGAVPAAVRALDTRIPRQRSGLPTGG